MKNRITLMLTGLGLLALLILSACSLTNGISNLIGDDTQTVEAQVAATLQAMEDMKALETETIAPTPENQTGTLTGRLSYPSEFLPPQRVVAFDINDIDTYFIEEVSGSDTYVLEVPVGTYYVLSNLIDPDSIGAQPGLGAAYSEFVLCGLQYGCEDHSLVAVEVSAGQVIQDVDPIDWYLPLGEDAGWPADPTLPATGSIKGQLGYPSEYIPPLRVVAFDVYSEDYFFVDTLLNQSSYQLTGVPAGVYQVVAFVQEAGNDLVGGYSQFVPCGMAVDCNNHNLIEVFVYGGRMVENIDPIDFYMPPGASEWSADPTH